MFTCDASLVLLYIIPTCMASFLYLIEHLCSCSLEGWAFLLPNRFLPRPRDDLWLGTHHLLPIPTPNIPKPSSAKPWEYLGCHGAGLPVIIRKSSFPDESYLSGRYSLAISTSLGPINSFQCCKQLSLNKTRARDGPLLKEKQKQKKP